MSNWHTVTLSFLVCGGGVQTSANRTAQFKIDRRGNLKAHLFCPENTRQQNTTTENAPAKRPNRFAIRWCMTHWVSIRNRLLVAILVSPRE